MRSKSFTLHLGFDGAYVLALAPLEVLGNEEGGRYLSPTEGKCIDLGAEGRVVFERLGLKRMETVRLHVKASWAGKSRSK